MAIYTLAELSQNLLKILEQAKENKDVIVQGSSGELFSIQMISSNSLYNLPKMDIGLSRSEIVSFVRESRETKGI